MENREALSPSHLLGQAVGRGYRCVALLDGSGKTLAFRAWDHSADRYVVVKVGRMPASAAMLSRFSVDAPLSEYNAAGVVSAIDHGVHAGAPYVVLPYLAGGTLRQRRPLDDDRPLLAHPSLLHKWLPAVATALDGLHQCKAAHGTLSPDTILFDAAQQPMLADFRIAAAMRAADPHPDEPAGIRADEFSGRFRYCCPQGLLGAAPSPAGDRFSLAAIVYDYLAAKPPFAGSTPAAVAAAQATHDTVPIDILSPELPPSLCKALHRGLEHKPRDRHATCREFAAALLADVAVMAIPSRLRLLCPSCGKLVVIEPEAAGRAGNCLLCQTQIEVDRELRWLILPNDRRADLPVAGAKPLADGARRRWLPVAIASLAVAAAVAMLLVRGPEPPPQPDGPPAQQDAPAIAPAPQPPLAANDAAPPELGVPNFDPVEPRKPPLPTRRDEAALVNEPPKQIVPIDPQKQAADDAPAAAPPPPARDPAPPAGNARPVARDIAMDEVRGQLQTLHSKRRELMATRDKLERTIVDHKAMLTSSERSSKQAEIGRKEAEVRGLLWQRSFETNPARLALLSQEIKTVDAEFNRLRGELGNIDKELTNARATIDKATAELEKNDAAIELFRHEWVAFLNPLERDDHVAIKINELSSDTVHT